MEQTHNEDSIPALMFLNGGLPSKEKQLDAQSDSVEIADEKVDIHTFDKDEDTEYRNGEQVIVTGRDVSRFVVDTRDDGDEALTFRSIVLGTLFAGMGAALCQVSIDAQSYPRSNNSRYFCPRLLALRKADCFRPDLPFQACPNDGVHSILAPDYLYCGKWLGKVLPSTQLGRWH